MTLGLGAFLVFAAVLLGSAWLAIKAHSRDRCIISIVLCCLSACGVIGAAGAWLAGMLVLATALLTLIIINWGKTRQQFSRHGAARKAVAENRVLLWSIAILFLAQVILAFAGVSVEADPASSRADTDAPFLVLGLGAFLVFSVQLSRRALRPAFRLAPDIPGQMFRDQAMVLRVKDVNKRKND